MAVEDSTQVSLVRSEDKWEITMVYVALSLATFSNHNYLLAKRLTVS